MRLLDRFHCQISKPPTEPAQGRIVLLHGLMGAAANWMQVTSRLAKEFEVLAFDQRGHGQSFQPEQGYAPEDFAKDLREVLDAVGWDTAHLLGHSMGGRNAMVFASLWPERVEKLVLEDIGPDANQMNVERINEMFRQIPDSFANSREARDYFYSTFPEGPGQAFDNPVTLGKYLYSNQRKMPSGEWGWRFSLKGVLDALREGRMNETWDHWERLQGPVLLLRGEKSVELPQDVFERMLALRPHVKSAVFKGCGHWLHYEQTDLFIKTVVEFLKE